jgi:hypothetical protein
MTPSNTSHDISQITDYLFISAWPRGEHGDQIRALDVRLILSMHWRRPSQTLGHTPVRLLWLPTLDSPLTPLPMFVLKRGVEAALPIIADGWKVLVHCKYGIHRSVAMACCILIGTGHSADEAMRLVAERRAAADPYAAYVQRRIRKFEEEWRKLYPLH